MTAIDQLIKQNLAEKKNNEINFLRNNVTTLTTFSHLVFKTHNKVNSKCLIDDIDELFKFLLMRYPHNAQKCLIDLMIFTQS